MATDNVSEELEKIQKETKEKLESCKKISLKDCLALLEDLLNKVRISREEFIETLLTNEELIQKVLSENMFFLKIPEVEIVP